MSEMKIAMAFITHVDQYMFERRKEGHANGATGLIGCYGGQIEAQDRLPEDTEDSIEPARRAVLREVAKEETRGLENFPLESYRYLGRVSVTSDRNNQEVKISAEVFQLLLPYGWKVEADNSTWLNLDQLVEAKKNNQLTPATEAACTELLEI